MNSLTKLQIVSAKAALAFVNAIGFDGEGLKEIIEDARIEDRNHFEVLTPRIYELRGALPRDIRGLADVAGCPDAYLPPG